ncbi:hypothetical protein [Sphingomonas sp.]|uniref:hypothetical protein n=1 Tax=Sphingomonas sp. TaxID=28214 RepID=UPI0025F64233|nr:hypothetical protein [Sphingomonas sp.]MBV9527481.1 hypothetical protein [Sphingomonas sp.]
MSARFPDIQAEAPERREEWRFTALVIIAGVALRLYWLARSHGRLFGMPTAGEAYRAALSVARHGVLGDAYFVGQGPSAHLLPVNPMIAGGVLWAFGPGSVAANVALLAWAAVQVVGGYLLVRALFRQLGASAAVQRWGIVLLLLVPSFVPQEVIEFRYWEGGSAVCLAAINLLMIVRLDERRSLDTRALLAAAGLSAITFFISPSAGLAVDLCWAVVALRRLSFLRAAQFGIASALALTLLIVPWAIRNERALGETVLLRSNFGLEFAMANHDAALSDGPRPPAYVYHDRFDKIHPGDQNSGLQPLIKQRGAEVRYSRALARQTEAWVAAHPWGFARLCLRHFHEFFFPEPWQMYFTEWEGLRTPRSVAISLVDLLGLIGLTLGLFSDRRRYWIPLLYIFAVAVPYSLFQPVSRYIFLVYPMLAFGAIEGICRLAAAMGRSRKSGRDGLQVTRAAMSCDQHSWVRARLAPMLP